MLHFTAHIARRCPVDLGTNAGDAVLVAGVGRSGTTWLADLVNYDNAYRVMFEPLHAWKIEAAQVLTANWYLPRGASAPTRVAQYVDAVIHGRVRHRWVDRDNRRVFARRRLIKAIRANLMLGWLRETYPELRIVLLIRHPLAVYDSRSRLSEGWEWRPDLAELVQQDALIRDHLSPFTDVIDSVRDDFEETIVSWCIGHYVPFRQLEAGEVLIVFYERLVTDPEPELRRLFQYLGKPWDERCLVRCHVPSRTTRGAHVPAGIDPRGQLGRWHATLTDGQIDWSETILERFGLAHIYGDQDVPTATEEALFRMRPSPEQRGPRTATRAVARP